MLLHSAVLGGGVRYGVLLHTPKLAILLLLAVDQVDLFLDHHWGQA